MMTRFEAIRQNKVAPAAVLSLVGLVLMIYGITLVTGLRGGDESKASKGTAYIVLTTIVLGNTIMDYLKTVSDGSSLYLFTVSKQAAIGTGVLFIILSLASSSIGAYRTQMVIDAIAYGTVGLFALFASSANRHNARIEPLTGGHTSLAQVEDQMTDPLNQSGA